MARKTGRTKTRARTLKKSELSPVMQIGVVFVIVAAMLLLMYAARVTP